MRVRERENEDKRENGKGEKDQLRNAHGKIKVQHNGKYEIEIRI